MSIHLAMVKASKPEELAQLLDDMSEETKKYRSAFYAAKGFIDVHAADPDITPEMVEAYDKYDKAKEGL